MKKLSFVFTCGAMCAFAILSFSQTSSSQNTVPGRYIVLFNDEFVAPGTTSSAVEVRSGEIAAHYGGSVDKVFVSAVRGFSASLSNAGAAALSKDPRVRLVEADRKISVNTLQTNAPWNLDRVDQRFLPWDTIYDYSGSGSGVHVYIIDTGIRVTHIEFGGRASIAYDNVGDGQNGADCNGHGTHVAGIVGGATWGIAKNVYLHAVRVLPCSGSGLLSSVLAGVDWLTANHASPAVANISATVPGMSVSLETAIANSIASGVTYTIAAGNAAADACGYTPARTPNAMTVGASDETDLRARYSNYGPCIDLFAPGNLIVSSWASSDTATNNLSGTSMAAPMVAGAAAIYLGTNPSASPSTVMQAIRSAATQGVLTTNDTTSPNLLLYSRLGLLPTAASATILGRVINSAGIGVRGVTLELRDSVSGETRYARTNYFGIWSFQEVQTGRTYLLVAYPTKRFEIPDNVRTIAVNDDVSGIDLVASTFTY
jgi:subtilisin family serine protease